MLQSKTLKIFLLNGEPTGIKIVEMSNWTGKAFVIPRNKLKDILQREEVSSQAIYFLIGKSEKGEDKVYVGEAENFKKRIQQHNQNKDFWNLAICFISKDENLNKAHVRYLESIIIKEINEIGRIELENGNGGGEIRLSESDEADMNFYLENLKIVLSALGFSFLEDIMVHNEIEEEVYFVKGRGVNGIIKLTNEGYVVQRGSVISGEDVPSFEGKPLSVFRHHIFNSDKVKKIDNNYELLDNIIFSSPSYAATFILGRNINGWNILKNREGKTLSQLKR